VTTVPSKKFRNFDRRADEEAEYIRSQAQQRLWAEAITIKVYILQGHLPLGIDELGTIRELDSK